MPDSNPSDWAEIEKLYIRYLKALSPDWSDERIATEMGEVFKEQGLEQSEQRRCEFRASLVEQLEKIERRPDDWFLRDKGGNS